MSGKVIDTHVHQLRPFNYDPERTRPVDIARQTAQEFLIGDILAHRGDRNRRDGILGEMERFHGCRFVGAICRTQACREIA